MPLTATPTIAVFPEERLTIEQKVEKWVYFMCRSLEENYKQHSIRMYERGESEYSKKCLQDIKNGTANLTKFRMESGRKYWKIIQQDFDDFRDRNEYRDGGVHAFINKKTGEVYKPASWKSPAKHVRYDLRIISDREKLHDPNYTGWAGGYLYMR